MKVGDLVLYRMEGKPIIGIVTGFCSAWVKVFLIDQDMELFMDQGLLAILNENR